MGKKIIVYYLDAQQNIPLAKVCYLTIYSIPPHVMHGVS
jgi:hypothetical protein